MESQAQLSQQHRSQTPILQNIRKAAWCLGTSLRVYRTKGGAPVAEGLPVETNPIGDSGKTTEKEAHSPLAKVYACRVSWWLNPGKIWMPTNQVTAVSARAHVSRELSARAPQASRGI